jgi:hypothetical protein
MLVGPIWSAPAPSRWAHSRTRFFELADIATQARSKKQVIISPMALKAVKRIDGPFDIERAISERAISGKSIEERLAARRAHSAPLAASGRIAPAAANAAGQI